MGKRRIHKDVGVYRLFCCLTCEIAARWFFSWPWFDSAIVRRLSVNPFKEMNRQYTCDICLP